MSSLALGVALTVLSLLGLLLNGYIVLVVLLTKQVQAANNLLLLHLGVVDTLLCALFLLFSAPGMLRGGPPGWLTLTGPCSLHGFLFTLLHPVALWTVCGLNCDRYYAIAAPLHYGAVVNTRKVALGLGAAWIVALAFSIPPLFLVAPYRYSPGMAGCAPDFGLGDGAIWYSSIFTFLTLLVPAALILGCNIKVLMIARYHRHRIASAIFEVALSAQVTITHQRNPFMPPVLGGSPPKFRSGRSAVSTVLQLLGSFLVLYFPYYGYILWESSSSTFVSAGRHVHPHLVALASTLLTCSPPVNGLLYGVKSQLLRKTFQNYWRKQMSKSEMNQEIQARTPSACGSRRPSLTPLGLLTRPCSAHLQRRLSEVLLDPHRSSPHQKPKIQRIASELNWRPSSTSGLTGLDGANIMQRSRSFKDRINQHAASCNTLQVPNVEENETHPKNINTFRSNIVFNMNSRSTLSITNSRPNLFLQRVFGIGNYVDRTATPGTKRAAAIQTVLASTPRRSPRILITRAFSEESDHSPPAAPHGDKQYSTSTTSLLDRRWKKSVYHAETKESSSEQEMGTASTGDNNNNSCTSSSEDEDVSDESSGRLYMSLDGTSRTSTAPLCGTAGDATSTSEGNSGNGDASVPAYILSWPTSRRKTMAVSSRTRVQLARSFVDITDAPEFVL
ncbi:uncharacterized protein [Anabrus simplex]|uniref:uncharacterized protein n=1 Tax=Anabrus simplex TaxID=316456 RepID=UPI0035A26E45